MLCITYFVSVSCYLVINLVSECSVIISNMFIVYLLVCCPLLGIIITALYINTSRSV